MRTFFSAINGVKGVRVLSAVRHVLARMALSGRVFAGVAAIGLVCWLARGSGCETVQRWRHA